MGIVKGGVSPHLRRSERITKEGGDNVQVTTEVFIQKDVSDDLPYACSECSMRFKFPNKLKRHFGNRHTKKHKCSVCEERFDDIQDLRYHCSNEGHNTPKVRIPKNVTFQVGADDKSSMPSTSETPVEILSSSGEERDGEKTERKRAQKKRRVERKKIELPYECSKCDMRFKFPNKLKRHFENRHSKKHLCGKCGDAFDEFQELRKHWAQQHRLFFKCDHCSYRHYKKAMIRRHTLKQHIDGVRCPFRGCIATMSAARLGGHISREHPSASLSSLPPPIKLSNLVHSCEWCPFETEDGQLYEKHVDSEHGAGVLCPFSGCSARLFLRHLYTHLSLEHTVDGPRLPEHPMDGYDSDDSMGTDSRPLSAPNPSWCREEQQLSDSEEEEERVEKETKKKEKETQTLPMTQRQAQINELIVGSFQCGECSKGFGSLYYLHKHVARVHEKRHSNTVRQCNYACDIDGCEKKFVTPGALEDHKNTHNGSTPFSCPSCEKQFTGRALLAKHLKRFHNTSIKHVTSVANSLGNTFRRVKRARTESVTIGETIDSQKRGKGGESVHEERVETDTSDKIAICGDEVSIPLPLPPSPLSFVSPPLLHPPEPLPPSFPPLSFSDPFSLSPPPCEFYREINLELHDL